MPESGTSTQFSSTGFQKQPVILTIQNTPINPVPKHSFKHVCFLLGTPWALAKVLLPPTCYCKISYRKSLSEQRLQVPYSTLQSSEKGLTGSPNLEIPWVCFFSSA